MTKYCANCGRELKDEAKYCPECGHEYMPRHKADGSSSDDFKGPFDDFNNRSSTNPFESSTKNTTAIHQILHQAVQFLKVCHVEKYA